MTVYVESLDSRLLLSAGARPFESIAPLADNAEPVVHLRNDGILIVKGTPGEDDIYIDWVTNGGTSSTFKITCNGVLRTYEAVEISGTLVRTFEGNDKLVMWLNNYGPTTIHGGAGNDSLSVSGGQAEVYGQSGDDSLDSFGNSQRLYGQSGNDRLYASHSGGELFGGNGNDLLINYGEPVVMKGGAGDDIFQMDLESGPMFGGRGTDLVHGNPADELLHSIEFVLPSYKWLS